VDFRPLADVLFGDTVPNIWPFTPGDDECRSGLPTADRPCPAKNRR
jgi:hypothetical protein